MTVSVLNSRVIGAVENPPLHPK